MEIGTSNTVEKLEANGSQNSKEVLERISNLEKIVQHLIEQTAAKDSQIEYLLNRTKTQLQPIGCN